MVSVRSRLSPQDRVQQGLTQRWAEGRHSTLGAGMWKRWGRVLNKSRLASTAAGGVLVSESIGASALLLVELVSALSTASSSSGRWRHSLSPDQKASCICAAQRGCMPAPGAGGHGSVHPMGCTCLHTSIKAEPSTLPTPPQTASNSHPWALSCCSPFPAEQQGWGTDSAPPPTWGAVM